MNIPYVITRVKTTDLEGRQIPAEAMLSAEDIARPSAELEAGLPAYWPAGTQIHCAGYDVAKEKDIDGSWKEI